MPNIQQLCFDNVVLLKQLANFVENLTSNQFTQLNTKLNSGSIAAHLRHIIEHYQTAMGSSTELDYDDRPRNHQLEHCQSTALKTLSSLQTQLFSQFNIAGGEVGEVETDPNSISIKCATNSQVPSDAVSSSLARELVFLHSHTTHHMAIIRLLALSDGIAVSDSFGKAASTKQYEQQMSSSDVQSKLA